MYRLVLISMLMGSAFAAGAQSEQKQFWALNGAFQSLTWDSTISNKIINNGNGTWDNSTRNWSFNKGTSNLSWRPGIAAIFGGNTGTGAAGTITVSGTQTVQSLTFNPAASGNFTITGGTINNISGNIIANTNATIASTLSGIAGLTMSGTGTITQTGSSSYTGTTAINSGTLVLSNGIANSTTPTHTNAVVIASGATLNAFIGGNVNISGNISGAGTLGITGAGAQTLRLYGNNASFTGNFFEPPVARGMMWSDNVGAGNAANTGSASAAWDLSGSFGFIETAASATPIVQLGSLSGSTSTTTVGGFGGSGTKTFQIGALNTNTSFAGAMQDNPQTNGTPVIALIKVGTGTLTMSGTNTYTGNTTVNAGRLAFSASVPSSATWNIAVNATTAPGTASAGLMTLPGSPALTGKTINIVLTGSSTGFTWTAMSWTGTASGTPTLKINGVTVSSGVASGGTTVTFTAASGVTVKR